MGAGRCFCRLLWLPLGQGARWPVPLTWQLWKWRDRGGTGSLGVSGVRACCPTSVSSAPLRGSRGGTGCWRNDGFLERARFSACGLCKPGALALEVKVALSTAPSLEDVTDSLMAVWCHGSVMAVAYAAGCRVWENKHALGLRYVTLNDSSVPLKSLRK